MNYNEKISIFYIKIKIKNMNEQMITEAPIYNISGWVCPKCGASLSPDTKICPNCDPKNKNNYNEYSSTNDVNDSTIIFS